MLREVKGVNGPNPGSKITTGILGNDTKFNTGTLKLDATLAVADLLAKGNTNLFTDQIGLLLLIIRNPGRNIIST